MTAVVMANYYFQTFGQGHVADYSMRAQDWMVSQMAQYPPPPPPDQQHYNALYPAPARAQQEQLQYSSLPQPMYSKIESTAPQQEQQNHPMHNLTQELQQHASLGHQSQPHPHQSSHVQQPSGLNIQQDGPDQSTKPNRLRKACDSCSIRKVKCDESGPPCKACRALDIPCTFSRPSRRRGPPNRHAEAIKRRRVDDPLASSEPSPPSSPTHAAQALAALSSRPSNNQLSADSICPVETLDLLIDDFFTYIHPLCPFPHEPSFREAWKRREDLSNSSFLALLASMMAALVSSFPRKPRLHLKAQKREKLFPNHMSLVTRCQKVCAKARGPGYLESENLSVYDAATSYFLALTGVYTFRWRLGRLYFGECLTIIRTLGLHKSQEQSFTQLGTLPSALGSHGDNYDGNRQERLDYITLEMGRRIYWTLFVGIKTMQQLGAAFVELLIPPPTPSEPYPPLPAEVDDFCIYPDRVEPQPKGLMSLITGFNANVKVFCAYNPLATMEIAWGIDAVVDWNRQKRVLCESLRRCKDAIKELPPELTIYPRSAVSSVPDQHIGPGSYSMSLQPHLPKDPASSLMNPAQRVAENQDHEHRRRMQHEIQKANIYASSLSTRSYLVEKYWNLCEAHDRTRSQNSASQSNSPSIGIAAAGLDGLLPQAPTSTPDSTDQEMRQERESIVKDLLVVLSNISEVNMEPNADSFTMKIRSIASTLLDVPDRRKGELALEAQEYLSAFLKILMRLERVSPANSDPDQPEDEEAELRHWADLREYQMKFAQQGGLLGLS